MFDSNKAIALAATLILGIAPLSGQVRFQVQKIGEEWWFVAPDKQPFLSIGVGGVNTGTSFVRYDPLNPTYSAFKFYPNRDEWAKATTAKIHDWRLNTFGAYSDTETLNRVLDPTLFETPVLNLGAGTGMPQQDPWSPWLAKDMEEIADRQIMKGPDAKRVIGYFSDDELDWSEGPLFDSIWKSAPGSGQRKNFVAVLRKSYGSWTALQKDFIPTGCGNLNDLMTKGHLFLRPGGSGMKAVQRYTFLVASRYYKLCNMAIKNADPAALNLGDRYPSHFYPEVALAAKPFVDVISTNLISDWSDGSYAHFYLSSLEKFSDKPILISAYGVTSPDSVSGNKNEHPLPGADVNQEERASLAEVQTKGLISQPYVLGAHWLEYFDDQKSDGGEGVNHRLGLVNILDKPYEALTDIFKNLDPNGVHANGPAIPQDARSGLPMAPATVNSLETWPRNQAYIQPTVDSGRADLYGCFSPDGLYLAIYWYEDKLGNLFYQGSKIPSADFTQIHLRVGKTFLKVSVPDTGDIALTGNATIVHEHRGLRNEVMVKIPGTEFGSQPLVAGKSFLIDVGLATQGRAYFNRWQGTFSLGGNG